MKCSSRRNCDTGSGRPGPARSGLNEVQFPKKLRLMARMLSTVDNLPQ